MFHPLNLFVSFLDFMALSFFLFINPSGVLSLVAPQPPAPSCVLGETYTIQMLLHPVSHFRLHRYCCRRKAIHFTYLWTCGSFSCLMFLLLTSHLDLLELWTTGIFHAGKMFGLIKQNHVRPQDVSADLIYNTRLLGRVFTWNNAHGAQYINISVTWLWFCCALNFVLHLSFCYKLNNTLIMFQLKLF